MDSRATNPVSMTGQELTAPLPKTFKTGNQPCTTSFNHSLHFARCNNPLDPGRNDRTQSGHGGSPPPNLFSCNNILTPPGQLGPDSIDVFGPAPFPTHCPRISSAPKPESHHWKNMSPSSAIAPKPPPPPPPPPSPTFTEVSDLLANLPEDIRWAVAHTSIPDNGLAIAQALVTGQAVSVSDASTKDSFGTANMVLEATPPTFRVSVVNITPGPVKDGDSTR